MRIAYVTTYDARDIRSWSGTGHFMWRALQQAGHEIDLVGPLDEGFSRLWDAKTRFYERVRHVRYERERQPWLQRHYARQVQAHLTGGRHDIVVSPGSIPVARLPPGIPVVFWADATFAGMLGFNPSFTGLAAETIRDGNASEQAALDRCSMAIYASEWARGTALEHYRVDAAKLRVVGFGANLLHEPDATAVASAIEARPFDECRLLFVAVDWWHKGGDIAVAVTRELVRRGIRASLTVVGITPPPDTADVARHAGYLDKRDPEQAARYETLLAGSHFLIVPSRSEAYGLVYAEASAHGVPSLATRLGGIPSVVTDEVNGRLFEPGADPSTLADWIGSRLAKPEAYRALARSSFEAYAARLSWTVAGRAVSEMLHTLIA